MKDQVAPRYPQLDSVRDELNRLKITWAMCCASPLLYLGFSHIISANWFTANEMGLYPLSDSAFRTAVIICAVLTALVQGVMLYVRRLHDAEMATNARSVYQMVRIYSRRTFKLMLLSECSILLGFVLFLMNGNLTVLFAFGLLSMAFYAQSYPSENGLGAFATSV